MVFQQGFEGEDRELGPPHGFLFELPLTSSEQIRLQESAKPDTPGGKKKEKIVAVGGKKAHTAATGLNL